VIEGISMAFFIKILETTTDLNLEEVLKVMVATVGNYHRHYIVESHVPEKNH
jgi:hypothetical protein